MFDFDRVLDRSHTSSKKWNRYPADVLPLWVADMDFAVAPAIVAALQARIAHPVFGYAMAENSLRAVLVAHLAGRYGWRVEPEAIVLLPGVDGGINMALKAWLRPGDAVAVPTPVYGPLRAAPGHWGMRRVDLKFEADRGHDPEHLAAVLREARALLLCNPHNPLGKVYRREELQAIADVCLANGTFIVSDEIHCDLLYDGRVHTPIASLDPAIAARSVTLMAGSKSYNIAGLKCAFAVIPDPALRAAFEGCRMGMVDSGNVLGMVATEAAYAHGGAWLEALKLYLQGNRDFLMGYLASHFPEIRVDNPEGTFLAWLDCSAGGLADPQGFFLELAKVALSAGHEFAPDAGQFVRLNFGCSRGTLEVALERMRRAWAAR